jgi:hypothetical protein
MNDPHGYARLARSLDFLIVEVGEAGADSSGLSVARRFYGGSPSEFLGESLLALEATLNQADSLPSSVAAFAHALAAEIRVGFQRIGGG